MSEANKIVIRGGFVEMREYVTRKAAREYQNELTNSGMTDSEGHPIVTGPSMNRATEGLVLAMIKRVVVVSGDNTETEVPATEEWLDEMDQEDFDKISDHVLSKHKKGRGDAKKSSSSSSEA